MVALAPPPWTVDVPLMNRKRSRLALGDDDDDNDADQHAPEPSPALSAFSDSLKKTRTQSDLEELDIISPREAWSVDVDGILASNTLPTPTGSNLQAHSNVSRYKREDSIIVLCVQGNVQLHYDLLW